MKPNVVFADIEDDSNNNHPIPTTEVSHNQNKTAVFTSVRRSLRFQMKQNHEENYQHPLLTPKVEPIHNEYEEMERDTVRKFSADSMSDGEPDEGFHFPIVDPEETNEDDVFDYG
jgi:hypothetical protein